MKQILLACTTGAVLLLAAPAQAQFAKIARRSRLSPIGIYHYG